MNRFKLFVLFHKQIKKTHIIWITRKNKWLPFEEKYYLYKTIKYCTKNNNLIRNTSTKHQIYEWQKTNTCLFSSLILVILVENCVVIHRTLFIQTHRKDHTTYLQRGWKIYIYINESFMFQPQLTINNLSLAMY